MSARSFYSRLLLVLIVVVLICAAGYWIGQNWGTDDEPPVTIKQRNRGGR